MNTIFSSRLFVLCATLITTWVLLTIAAGAQTSTQVKEQATEQSQAAADEPGFTWTIFSDLPPYQLKLNVGVPNTQGIAQVEVQIGEADTAMAAQTLTMDRGLCYAESVFAEDVNNDGYVDLALICVDRNLDNSTVLRSWLFDSVAGTFVPNPTDQLVADDETRD